MQWGRFGLAHQVLTEHWREEGWAYLARGRIFFYEGTFDVALDWYKKGWTALGMPSEGRADIIQLSFLTGDILGSCQAMAQLLRETKAPDVQQRLKLMSTFTESRRPALDFDDTEFPSPPGTALPVYQLTSSEPTVRTLLKKASKLALGQLAESRTDRLNEVDKLIAQAENIEPVCPELTAAKTLVLLIRGQMVQVHESIERFLELRPHLTAPLTANQAAYLAKKWDLRRASTLAERSLHLFPANTQARNAKFKCDFLLGRWHDKTGWSREIDQKRNEWHEGAKLILQAGGKLEVPRALAIKADQTQG